MTVTSDAAHLPIARVLRLNAVCDDCGRRFSMDRHAVAREQLRRGLATPEALGSCLRCMLCAERGGEGRNVSIVVQYMGGRTAAAPGSDLRPLTSLAAATVRCCDCGHAVAFDEDALDAMPDVETVDDLWRMAFCQPCRTAGAAKPNMTLETNPPRPSADRTAGKPNWSRAQVFGDDRSTPFPNLPPSRLMRG